MSVGQIAEWMEMSQPAISHHLRTLRILKLVRIRKVGRTVFYALDDQHIEHLLHEGLSHVKDFVQ